MHILVIVLLWSCAALRAESNARHRGKAVSQELGGSSGQMCSV